jgi:DNA-binding XRE family transcriptional regulator
VSDSAAVRALRRELGRRLAAARKDAGYAQRDLARRISYARSTLSTVESGIQRAGRAFWEACDDAPAPVPGQQREGLRAAALPEALRAYRALGWPVVSDGSVAELVTGTVLDALQVPQAAGILAACWWQATGGSRPDPGPASAARSAPSPDRDRLRRQFLLPRRGWLASLVRTAPRRRSASREPARHRLALGRQPDTCPSGHR